MKLISIVGRKQRRPVRYWKLIRDVVVHSFVDASCVAQTQGFCLRLSWIEDAHFRRCPTDKIGKKKHAREHFSPCEQTLFGKGHLVNQVSRNRDRHSLKHCPIESKISRICYARKFIWPN
jgi:hypothetical protein